MQFFDGFLGHTVAGRGGARTWSRSNHPYTTGEVVATVPRIVWSVGGNHRHDRPDGRVANLAKSEMVLSQREEDQSRPLQWPALPPKSCGFNRTEQDHPPHPTSRILCTKASRDRRFSSPIRLSRRTHRARLFASMLRSRGSRSIGQERRTHRLYWLRLHRFFAACRLPRPNHALALATKDRRQADRADGRRHDTG